MLIADPGLVRVRLELARAFFLKGEDRLARRHFERVLAGNVPPPVAANVRRFLAQMRARRRWTAHFGFALAPDTNIGGGSEERIVTIHGLPFRRDAEELTKPGIGLSVWTGGEYQHPLAWRWWLRAGADASRRDYSDSRFDQTFVSVHAGPRWLIDGHTEASLLANPRRRWAGTAPSYDDLGARLEGAHRFTRRVTANASVSRHERAYRTQTHPDGPTMDVSLGAAWMVTPTLRADAAAGWGLDRPETARWRHDGPAPGLHGGRQRRAAPGRLRGQLVPPHRRRAARGPYLGGAALGPQPRDRLERIQPAALPGARGSRHQRPALRRREGGRGVEVRKGVLRA